MNAKDTDAMVKPPANYRQPITSAPRSDAVIESDNIAARLKMLRERISAANDSRYDVQFIVLIDIISAIFHKDRVEHAHDPKIDRLIDKCENTQGFADLVATNLKREIADKLYDALFHTDSRIQPNAADVAAEAIYTMMEGGMIERIYTKAEIAWLANNADRVRAVMAIDASDARGAIQETIQMAVRGIDSKSLECLERYHDLSGRILTAIAPYLALTADRDSTGIKQVSTIPIELLDPKMPTQALRLMGGELTSNEVRVARAFIECANSRAMALLRKLREERGTESMLREQIEMSPKVSK